MIVLRFLAILFSLGCLASGSTTTAPTTEHPCVDVHIWIWDGSRDCKYLTALYPDDSIYRIYEQRVYFCTRALTRCCASCKIVNAEANSTTTGATTIAGVTTTTVVTTTTSATTTTTPKGDSEEDD